MRHPDRHLLEFDPDALADRLAEAGRPRYRAGQILTWIWRHRVIEPESMTNLGKADRAWLGEHFAGLTGPVVRDATGSDGTRKLLVRWEDPAAAVPPSPAISATPASTPLPILEAPGEDPSDGNGAGDLETECVMIPSGRRRTACISSQVGCPVGCRFCASGLGGLDGNLSAGRIVEQVWRLDRDLHRAAGAGRDETGRITNVVFMGMGEPLANYAAVVRAVRILQAEWGLGLSGRRITISTVGLAPAMRRLADEGLPVTLALSLHAPHDDLRRELIPWAEYVSIDELLDAGRYYFERTGREITLEYILHGVNVHIRASRGRDIAAACGQLRHESRTAPA